MAKAKQAKRPTVKATRQQQRDRIDAALRSLTQNYEQLRKDKKQAALLSSVAEGLYDELDKLSKKAPVDEATDLVVNHVNDLVQDVRALTPDDPYIQRISAFVPAGDNPQHRDVLLVLRQLTHGISRCFEDMKGRDTALKSQIDLARGLLVALDFYLESDNTQITKKDLEVNRTSLPKHWWTSGIYGDPETVDLSLIDRFPTETLTDLP